MSLDKHFANVVDRTGKAVVGASVQVTNYFGGAVSTLLEDDESTPLPNPLTTDADGRYEFCAATGLYNINITYAGSLTQYTHVVMVGTGDVADIRRIFSLAKYIEEVDPLLGASFTSYLNTKLHEAINVLVNLRGSVFSTCTFV